MSLMVRYILPEILKIQSKGSTKAKKPDNQVSRIIQTLKQAFSAPVPFAKLASVKNNLGKKNFSFTSCLAVKICVVLAVK
jgi:hypothetical protein